MNGIHIEISGDPQSGKTLIGNVIHKALGSAGFTSVTLIDESGEPCASYEPQSILDMVQMSRPDLFTTPITIGETTMADAVDEDLINQMEKNLDELQLSEVA